MVLIHSGVFYPFHLHKELAYQIELSLNSSTRSEPDVRIDLPYDPFLFAGGLQQSGKLIKKTRGHDVYGIKKYSSLAPLLGDQWHLRLLKQYDFCYVMLDCSILLAQREPILDPIDSARGVDGGFLLVFKFVCGHGVRRHWEDIIQIE